MGLRGAFSDIGHPKAREPVREILIIKSECCELYRGEGNLYNWQDCLDEQQKGRNQYELSGFEAGSIKERRYITYKKRRATKKENGQYNLSRVYEAYFFDKELEILQSLISGSGLDSQNAKQGR